MELINMKEEVTKTPELAEPFIDPPNTNCNVDVKRDIEGGRCCGKCNCTARKCCTITAVILIIIGLVIAGGALRYYLKLTGTASSEDSEMWEEELEEDYEIESNRSPASLLDGKFSLVSYAENYHDYLTALGMPSFVASMILSSSETVTFTEPHEGEDGIWKRHVKTDLDDGQTVEFRLGKVFSESMGNRRKTYFNTTCSLSGTHLLVCHATSVEPVLEIETTYKFSRRGFIETRSLLTKNVTTKKYFERVSDIGERNDSAEIHEDDELKKKIEEGTKKAELEEKKNPFSSGSDFDDEFGDF